MTGFGYNISGFGGFASRTPTITRGVFATGANTINTIDYITIQSTGNATDFGDTSAGKYGVSGVSSLTRGVFAGGYAGTYINVIEYITIATPSNTTDFGDLTSAKRYTGGCADATRGLIGGGQNGSVAFNVIEYITIATTGNGTDFGDLSEIRNSPASFSDSTRGVWAGGSAQASNFLNVIDYVTIQSTGNATDFGDLTTGTRDIGSAGLSDSTRGLVAGGSVDGAEGVTTIDYVTIQTTGNATDFGDLLAAKFQVAGCADATRGVWGGGNGSSNVIQYVTIQSTGNTTDFGDLTVGRGYATALSGAA